MYSKYFKGLTKRDELRAKWKKKPIKGISTAEIEKAFRKWKELNPIQNEHLIPTENKIYHSWDGNKIIRFGAVGDNQLCSKYQQLTFLHSLYDLFEAEGITDVYNLGDVSEGYYKGRAGHIFDLIPGCIGCDEQADYIIKNYPKRRNIITRAISGNHDHTHIKNGGTNILRAIAREREDIKYLGCSNATVYLTPNCIMEINHPEDGSAYAISYSPQKYMDSMSGGQKPNILLLGHYHKAEYLFYRNIHCVQCATTCAQTPWMRSHKIAAHVGGWIIEIHVNDDGEITRFKSEYIPQYKTKQEDF